MSFTDVEIKFSEYLNDTNKGVIQRPYVRQTHFELWFI